MSRQVRVEAVFDTSKALSSLQAYQAAIQQTIALQSQLGSGFRGGGSGGGLSPSQQQASSAAAARAEARRQAADNARAAAAERFALSYQAGLVKAESRRRVIQEIATSADERANISRQVQSARIEQRRRAIEDREAASNERTSISRQIRSAQVEQRRQASEERAAAAAERADIARQIRSAQVEQRRRAAEERDVSVAERQAVARQIRSAQVEQRRQAVDERSTAALERANIARQIRSAQVEQRRQAAEERAAAAAERSSAAEQARLARAAQRRQAAEARELRAAERAAAAAERQQQRLEQAAINRQLRSAQIEARRSAAEEREANQSSGFGGGRGPFGLNATQMFGAAMVIGAVSAATRNVIQYSDAWADVSGRIKVAAGDMANLKQIQNDLFDTAQRTRVAISEVANQFSRLMFAGKEMGVTVTHARALTDAITDAGRASYRTQSEIASFITQFPQMLSFGKAGSEEWRTMKEGFPLVIETIAKNLKKANGEFGVTRLELENMQKAGKLFSDQIVNAIIRGAGELREKAAQVPRTFEQATTQLSNAWTKAVGEMAEKTGFTDRMTKAMDKLIEVVNSPQGLAAISGVMNGVVASFEAVTSAINMAQGAIQKLNILMADGSALWSGFKSAAMDKARGFYRGANDFLEQAIARATGSDAARSVHAEQARRNALPSLSLLPANSFNDVFSTTVTRASAIPEVKSKHPEDEKEKRARENLEEKIKLLREQVTLGQASLSGSRQEIAEATVKVEIERAISAEVRKNHPQQALIIEALIRQNVELEKQRELQRQDNAVKERLNALREQTELHKAELTNNEKLIDDAKVKLSVERLTTQEWRDRNQVQAAALVAAEQQRMAQERGISQTREWSDLYRSMGDTLVNAMMQAGKEGRKFSDGLKDVGRTFAEMLMKALVLQPLVNSIASGLGGSTQSASGGGTGFLVKAILGAVGAAAGSAAGGATAGASFSGAEMQSMNGYFANGGVVSGMQPLRVSMFAAGGVVDAPTAFRHAGGIGVMGEAGSEAIMPLRRGRDGKMGVMASGAGSAQQISNNFNISVAGDMTDATRERLVRDMERIVEAKAPGIVRQSVGAVSRENRANPSYLRR